MTRPKPALKDRVFVAFLSTLLVIPTGLWLWFYFKTDHSGDNPDWVLKLLLRTGVEIAGIVFFCGVLGIIWAMFTPAWLGRVGRFALGHFMIALGVALCIILGMLGYALFTLYHA